MKIPAKKFAASDEFIAWATSLSGFLTTIKTKHGGGAELLKSAEWDEAQTMRAKALISALHKHIAQLDQEITTHVAEKYG